MRTIEEIKAKCEIIPHDGSPKKEHWLWTGAARNNRKGKKTVCCSAPDFTKDSTGATMTIQTVMRAVRHIVTRKPIRRGVEACRTCCYETCISPDCTKWLTRKQRGAHVRQTGEQRGNPERNVKAVAARWTPERRKITPELYERIVSDPTPAVHLAPQIGLHHTTVSWVRRGNFQGAAAGRNPFAGLMR